MLIVYQDGNLRFWHYLEKQCNISCFSILLYEPCRRKASVSRLVYFLNFAETQSKDHDTDVFCVSLFVLQYIHF